MPAGFSTILAVLFAGAAGAGCAAFGGKPAPPTEQIEIVEPDMSAALAAGPFADDAALNRALQSDGAVDRAVGAKGREFGRVGVIVTAAALCPDGNALAAGGADGAVRIDPLYGGGPERSWETPAAARMVDESRHPPRPAPVSALAFFRAGDDRYLAAAGAGGTVQIWALGRDGIPLDPSPIRRNPVVVRLSESELHALVCHPTKPIAAAAGADGQVRLLRLTDGRILGRPAADGHRNSVKALDFSPDGSLLASADDDGVVLIRRTDALMEPSAAPAPGRPKSEKAPADPPATRSDGAVAGGGSARPAVDAPPAARLSVGGSAKTGADGAGALAFSPATRDGLLLALGTREGRLALWRIPPDKPQDAVFVPVDVDGRSPHSGTVRSAAFSPDGRFFASGGSDGAARLWLVDGEAVKVVRLLDPGSGKAIREVSRETFRRPLSPVHDFHRGMSTAPGAFHGEVSAVRFTPDGLELLAAADQSVALYRARTLDGRALSVGKAGRPIDWTRPAPPASFTVVAELVSDPVRDTVHVVRLRLNNTATRKDADLYQIVGVTDCRFPPVGDPNFNRSRPVPGLHGRPVYFGKVASGGSAVAEMRLAPEEPLPYGDYEIAFHWQHAHQPTAIRVGSVRVPIGAKRAPLLAAAHHLQEETVEPDGVLQFGERASAALFIKNVGSATAENVRVRISPAAETENLDAAPFSLEIRGEAVELNLGDLKPGEYRRRLIGPISIKSAGNPGGQLPETSLPLKLSLIGAGPGGATVERTLRIAVGPPLDDAGPPRPTAEHYRIADPDERESAVVQFRAGPGAESPSVAQTAAARAGTFAAEGARGQWIRMRLPVDLVRRLAEIEFQQPFVWVRRSDVTPAPKALDEGLESIRAVPYGDDAPTIDHNLPENRRVRGAVHLLRGVVADKDGLRRITVTVDRTEEKVLFDAAASPTGGPVHRFVIPKTEIDFSNHLRREVVITAEDASPARHKQVIRVVLEREGG